MHSNDLLSLSCISTFLLLLKIHGMRLKTRDSRVTLVNSYPLSLISLHKEQSQLFVTSHWNKDHKRQRGSFSEAVQPEMRMMNLLPALMKQSINFAHLSLRGWPDYFDLYRFCDDSADAAGCHYQIFDSCCFYRNCSTNVRSWKIKN